jgi:4-aminobutyrate aminotransferase-like enzyme
MNVDTLLARRHRLLGHHSPLFYRQPLHIVRGEGVWLWDADGRRYLDCYNNVPCVGHCHPRVVEAIARQAATLNVHTRYLHEGILDYAERLTSTFDAPLDSLMLACSGSEANELALRMARHLSGAQGILVTDIAYHGNTEAVSETGTAFMPEAKATRRVRAFAAPDSYRCPDGLHGEALTALYLQGVREGIEYFQREGLGVAGILVCPAFANEGLLAPPPGFLEQAVALVREAGGLYIADEVQGGFGRTGQHWWSHQASGVVPDLVTLGKPMGNGYPISGLVAPAAMVETFGAWGMYFNTFAGSPVACAAAMAVLETIEQEGLLQNAVSTGARVAAGLRTLQSRHALIGEVRDRGLFFAVELVTDRAQKTPATEAAGELVNRMRERGVLISRIGRHDSVLKIRPPLPFGPGHADQLLATLDDCLGEF